MGIGDAEHEEYGDPSRNYIIRPVACPVPNRADGAPKLSGLCKVRIRPGTRLFDIYGREEAGEEYFCNYEVNPRYAQALEAAGLRVSAVGEDGEIRAVELPDQRFFIATLFQPQLATAQPHPFVLAYLEAAAR